MGFLFNKRRNYIYNTRFIIINKYTKILRYVLTTKIIIVIELVELIYKEIIFRFKVLKSIIPDKELVFINIF